MSQPKYPIGTEFRPRVPPATGDVYVAEIVRYGDPRNEPKLYGLRLWQNGHSSQYAGFDEAWLDSHWTPLVPLEEANRPKPPPSAAGPKSTYTGRTKLAPTQTPVTLHLMHEFEGTVKSLHMSSSVFCKFEVLLNDYPIATLFTTPQSLQTTYNLPVHLSSSDSLKLRILNRDMLHADVYATVEYLKQTPEFTIFEKEEIK